MKTIYLILLLIFTTSFSLQSETKNKPDKIMSYLQYFKHVEQLAANDGFKGTEIQMELELTTKTFHVSTKVGNDWVRYETAFTNEKDAMIYAMNLKIKGVQAFLTKKTMEEIDQRYP
jgi:hypothetical protein